MVRGGKRFDPSSIIMIIVIAIASIYLFDVFWQKGDYKCKPTDIDKPDTTKDESRFGCVSPGDIVQRRQFEVPDDVQKPSLNLMSFVILGLAVFLGYRVITWTTKGSMSRKDIMSLIVLGVVVYLLWVYVVSPIWGASSFDTIKWKFANALGLN